LAEAKAGGKQRIEQQDTPVATIFTARFFMLAPQEFDARIMPFQDYVEFCLALAARLIGGYHIVPFQGAPATGCQAAFETGASSAGCSPIGQVHFNGLSAAEMVDYRLECDSNSTGAGEVHFPISAAERHGAHHRSMLLEVQRQMVPAIANPPRRFREADIRRA
jgi:hypothetical protein